MDNSMAELYDDISDLSRPRIRILTIEPSSYSTDPIVCSLTTHDVARLPKYDALSYVWGDASQRVLITCNNTAIEITHNLYRAILSIREVSRYMVIWADAICINQFNLAERSSQVQIMNEIYQNAGSTLIWLGTGDQASTTIVDLCREIGMATRNEQPIPQLTKSPHILAEILQFFRRPWWTRSWVIQELCLSKNPIIIIGNLAIPWGLFASLIHRINQEVMEQKATGDLHGAIVTTMMHLIRSEGFVAAQALRNKKIELDNPGHPVGLLDVLSEFRNFATTDSRDKVYALLNLTSPPTNNIVPDYEISTSECYTKAALAILESTKDLRLFEALYLFERHRDPSLPSWVPQWDSESREEDPGLKVPFTLRSVAQKEKVTNCPDSEVPSNVSGSRYLSRLEFIYPNTLVLEGFILDSINAIGPTLDFPRAVHDHITDRSSFSVIDIGRLLLKGSHFQGRILDVMIKWQKMALNRQSYPTGEDAKHAFLATIYGPEANMEEAAATFNLAMRTNAPEKGLKWGINSILGGISSDAKLAFLGLMIFKNGLFQDSSFGAALPICYGKLMATTANGYNALLPKSAKLGDRIAIMSGGRKPFVVRPADEKWTVVGPCYIHGIMNGEAWAPAKVHRMEFV